MSKAAGRSLSDLPALSIERQKEEGEEHAIDRYFTRCHFRYLESEKIKAMQDQKTEEKTPKTLQEQAKKTSIEARLHLLKSSTDVVDIYQTPGGKIFNILSTTLNSSNMATQIASSVMSSIAFAIGGALYSARLIKKTSAQQRKLKIAYGILGVTVPVIAAMTCSILTILGFTAATVALPALIFIIASGFFLRFLRKMIRSQRGLNTDTLMEQKSYKLELALKHNAIERADRFALEILCLNYQKNNTNLSQAQTKQDEEQPYSNEIITTLINNTFQHNPIYFFRWLANPDSLPELKETHYLKCRAWALNQAIQIQKKQKEKFQTNRAFLILASLFTIGAILTAISIAFTLFPPAGLALIAASQIIGLTGAGLSAVSVLGIGGFLINLNLKEYQRSMTKFKDHPEIQQQLRFAMGFQMTGITVLAIAGIFMGVTAALAPFVAPGILIGIGATLLVIGLAGTLFGAYRAYKAKKEGDIKLTSSQSITHSPKAITEIHGHSPAMSPHPTRSFHQTDHVSKDDKPESVADTGPRPGNSSSTS